MTIDDTGPIPDTGLSNAEEPSNKVKTPSGKKVFVLCPVSLHRALSNSFFQTPEKRPEVRILEYSQVPGITISSRFQKFLSSKKAKTDHLNSQGQQNRSCELFYYLIFARSLKIFQISSEYV